MLSKLTDFAIFSVIFISSIVLFKTPFEFYISYIGLLLLLGAFVFKYRFPIRLLYLFLPLLFFGIINILYGNNTFGFFIKIYANLFVSTLFFYYVFEYYERDIVRFFSIYMSWAYVAAVIGVIQLVSYLIGFAPGYDFRILFGFNKWGVTLGGLGIRVNSIFCEPSYVGATLGPAFFIACYNLVFNKSYFITRLQGLVIMFTYMMSTSSVAYIGVFFVLILLLINYGVVRYIFIAIPVSLILFYALYNNVKEFRLRVDGVRALYVEGMLEKEADKDERGGAMVQVMRKRHLLQTIHGSSFVQYNNYVITKNNFLHNPLFGTGLGSHQYIFSKYDLSYLLGGEYDNNMSDANSMLLRTISETGLFGLIFIILFIRNNYVKRDPNHPEADYHWLISNAVLVIILLQLARQGNYTFGGFIGFMWLYYYTKLDYVKFLEKENPEETSETDEPGLVKIDPALSK